MLCAAVASLTLQRVEKTLGGNRILRGIDLDVSDGELVVLVGPSGCGKSTLLRTIAGLEVPDGGTVTIGDRDVTRLAPKDRDVAMVFQSYALYPHLNVRKNLSFGLELRGEPKKVIDERVNEVTPDLFDRFPDAASLAEAEQEEVEQIVRSTGFFRNKAKNIIGFAQGVVEEHGGEVPRTMGELTDLPGVGRKTANVILGNAFGIDEGVVVDTHVRRLSNRLRFTGTARKKEKNVRRIEKDLMELFPRDRWTMLSHLLIWHGRRVCDARKPECGKCVVSHLCPSSRV